MNLNRTSFGQRVGVKAGIPYARLSIENNVRVVLANGYGGILDMSARWVTTWKGSCYIHEHTWGSRA